MKRGRFFAKTGLRWIQLSVISVIMLYMLVGIWSAIAALVMTLVLMRYYHDPERELPSHPLGIMSPVDGFIERIEKFYDPFIQRPAQRIRIKANLFRVYHERSPIEGTLLEYWPLVSKPISYGTELKASAWWIQTDEQDDVVMVVIGKPVWWRPSCYVQVGERIGQSRRYGHFPILSTVDILLAENVFIQVESGQKIQAGIDSLATFNHDSDISLDK